MVTSGNRGIGAAVTDALLTRGASVVIGIRAAGEVEAVSRAVSWRNGRAWPVELDHTRPDTIAAAARSAGPGSAR